MTTIGDLSVCDLDALNSLLRGEMAAVDTYTRAMDKFDDLEVIADLQKIRDEHSRAVRELRDLVIECGCRPADQTGASGAFAVATTAAANAAGPATVLLALRRAEEHGSSEYGAALENVHMPPEALRVFGSDLLPACHKHIEELDRLLGGMGH
jgi:hypothetical protein